MSVSPDWIVAGVAAVGVLFEAWRRWRKFSRAFADFLTDWKGSPERPGVPAARGVMERLAHQDAELLYVRHELSFNSGKSVKDTVYRIEQMLSSKDL